MNYKIFYTILISLLFFGSNSIYSRKLDTLAESSFYFINTLQQSSHNGGFSTFAGCSTCTTFDGVAYNNTESEQYSFGIGWEKRFTSNFTIQNRFTYTNHFVQFNTNPKFLSYTPENTKLYNQHNLNVNFQTIGYHIIPSYNSDWGFTFGLGLNANLNFAPTFEYYELLLDPSNRYAFNSFGASQRNIYPEDSKFKNPNEILYSISPTITFRNRIFGGFEIEPEISYHVGLNNVLKDKDVNWNFNTLSFGIKFHWVTNYQTYELSESSESKISQRPCKEGYERDKNGQCVPKCPVGFEYNQITNDCQKIVNCPEGYIKDSLGNCIIQCPEGYIFDKISKNCLKIKQCPDGYVLNSNNICVKNCPEGYIFNQSINDCEIYIPKADINCNGTYLGIQFNDLKKATDFLSYLEKELKIYSFEINQIQDMVDTRVILFELQSGCFDNIQNAIMVQRYIYEKLYPRSNFEEIEIILQTRK